MVLPGASPLLTMPRLGLALVASKQGMKNLEPRKIAFRVNLNLNLTLTLTLLPDVGKNDVFLVVYRKEQSNAGTVTLI